jgi:undecaprenyl-diphosphatase
LFGARVSGSDTPTRRAGSRVGDSAPIVAGRERRARPRGRFRHAWDLLFRALRVALALAHNFYGAVGVFLLAGLAVALLGMWAFAEFAEHVREGATQAFDVAVLSWVGTHQAKWLAASMLEITALGTGLVVFMIVAVAALFLGLTRHHFSAILLLAATAGGLVLNTVLKLYFGRPRPQVFAWGTHAVSTSFPSGHSMNAVIVYATVAYLAARLERRRWARWLTLAAAAAVIALICTSRVYLGVHYPSDVLGGLLVGLAWAAFCMSTLEAIQRFLPPRAAGAARGGEEEPEDRSRRAGV